MSDSIERAYAAGIFDGEGTVNIQLQNRGVTPYLHVTVTQKDIRLLRWLKECWPGGIYSSARVYVWQAYAATKLPFLLDIVPYLIVKREQVETAITFLQTPKSSHYRTLEDREVAEKFRLRLIDLKRVVGPQELAGVRG